jgi:hypothetical protein
MRVPLLLALCAAPAVAAACPACARDAGPNAALWIAGMIAAPYAIAWWVVRAIRGARP